MTLETSSDIFRRFLLGISEELTDDKLRKLKFLCREVIPDGELSNINESFQLFDVLIKKEKLSQRETGYLQKLLTDVGEDLLSSRVKDFVVDSQDYANHNSVMKVHTYGLPNKKRPFIGRDALVDKVAELLLAEHMRMVVLLGPPGFGKSSVVIHVGHALHDKATSVIFVSMRQTTSMHTLGTDILRSIDPEYSLSDDVVVQTKNYLVSLKHPTVLILDNSEDIQNSNDKSRDEFQRFIEYVGSNASNVQLLLGTRKHLSAISFESETIKLPSLNESSSACLLCHFASRKIDNNDDAQELGKQCGGVPLLIKIAGGRVKNGYKPLKLAEDLKTRPYAVLRLKGVQMQDYLTNSIRVFLDSLDRDMLLSLVKLSHFATGFSQEDVQKVFSDKQIDCSNMLYCLHENALLQLEGEQYCLHPLLQTFCREEQERMKCFKEGIESREIFTFHYLDELENIQKQFVSKDFHLALQRFDYARMNIEQARENAINHGTKKIKMRCIDVFNNSINLLGKIMQPSHCFKVYQDLYDAAVELQDNQQMSECLISIGFKHLCEVGHQQFSQDAFNCFVDATSLQKSLPKKKRQTEAYAHCLSKLGLCHVARKERLEGKRLMEQAIDIRRKLGDSLLLAASYCDKALAARFCDEHAQAITILKEHCYPQYKNHLEDHPWVASVLNYISESYKVLGKLEKSVKYSNMSLSMREKTLGHHQDTARSYVHLAKLLLHQDNFIDALHNYRQALFIQEKVLGVHEDTTASCRAIEGILCKLQMKEEQHEIRQRADSYQTQLVHCKTLQTQISQDLRKRADSHLETEQYKLNLKRALMVVLVAVVVTVLFSLII